MIPTFVKQFGQQLVYSLLDNLVSIHEFRFLSQIALIFFIVFPPAKAQERKDGSTEDSIIILLIEYGGVKRILREGNSSLKISPRALGVLL